MTPSSAEHLTQSLPPKPPSGAEEQTLPPLPPSGSSPALTHDYLPTAIHVAALPKLPGYEILGELGRGGMGVVYQARHLGLNRVVAVKMILAGSFADERLLSRFKAEAETLAKLQHPHIVQVYDIGTFEGKTYFSFEYVAGGSLDRFLRATPQPPHAAATFVALVADAMQAAHDKGIIHRDLKPANILLQVVSAQCSVVSEDKQVTSDLTTDHWALTTYSPKVTDFGLAKQSSSQVTVTGVVMGTPSYMAPEQAEAKGPVGPAADIYALGAILYEMLTGRPPFKAATPVDTIMQVVNEEPVSPAKLQPQTPKDVETICLKCLQKDPAKRYASAAAFAADLRRFLHNEPIVARPISGWERAAKWARRRPAVAGLLAALVIVVLTALASLLALWWEADEQRRLAVEANSETQLQRNDARMAQRLAEERADALNQRLYAVDMMQAQEAWNRSEFLTLASLLDRYQTSPLRGWEWHHHRWRLEQTKARQLAPEPNGIPFVVHSIAYHADGIHLAVAGEGNEVQVWNTHTGSLVHRLPAGAWVRCVALTPEGILLAATGSGQVRSWRMIGGEPGKTLQVSDKPVTQLSLSRDGRILATVDESGVFCVWELPEGKQVKRDEGFSRAALSPEGVHYALTPKAPKVGDTGGNAFLGSLADKEKIRLYQHGLFYVAHIAFSPKGDKIALAGYDVNRNGAVCVFDVESTRELFRCTGGMKDVRCVVFSPDGELLATGSDDNTVRLYDAKTGKEARRFRGNGYWYTSLAFNKDSKRLAAGSFHGGVEIWPTDLEQEAEVRQTGPKHLHWVLLIHPEGRSVFSVNTLPISISQGDFAGKQLHRVDAPTRKLARGCYLYSRDGRFLALGYQDGIVRLIDARTGKVLRLLEGSSAETTALAFSPEGDVLAACDATSAVLFWDTATGRALGKLENQPELKEVNNLALGPRGQLLLTAHGTLALHTWSVGERKLQSTLRPPGRFSRAEEALALAPQGHLAAWSMLLGEIGGNSVLVYDVAAGTERFRLTGHAKPVTHLAFSLDGLRLATGSTDGTVRLWDMRTGQEVLRLAIPEEALSDLRFTMDGQRLQALSRSNSVRTWPAPPAVP